LTYRPIDLVSRCLDQRWQFGFKLSLLRPDRAARSRSSSTHSP
jgi:hypothetical protein